MLATKAYAAAAFVLQQSPSATASTRTTARTTTPSSSTSASQQHQYQQQRCYSRSVTLYSTPNTKEQDQRTTTIAAAAAAAENTNNIDHNNISNTNNSKSTEEQEQEASLVKQQVKLLCEERNLPLAKVKNARDLASVRNSPIQPGRLFRMGRISDATDQDLQLLLQDIDLQTLVDLRSPTELKDDPTLLRSAVFANFTDVLWKEQGRLKDGSLRELAPGQGPIRTTPTKNKFWQRRNSNSNTNNSSSSSSVIGGDVMDGMIGNTSNNMDAEAAAALGIDFKLLDDLDDDEEDVELCDLDCPEPPATAVGATASKPTRKERHFVSLMNEFKYVKGTVSKLRKRDITKAILKSPGAVFSRRMRTSLKKPFLDEINDGGLPMLNELLLRYGAPGIRYVLELCADPARHPIAFYCAAGKDRTGMIAAIVLSLCGAETEDIVQDYTLSANVYAEMNDHQAMVGALSQRNLDPKTFLGAPASVMRDTLQAIQDDYGSVEGYCNWIGFGPGQQEQLRQACMTK